MSQLEAALAMARRGFPVFPLRVCGKKPAVSAFQYVATTDENVIREWWKSQPKYNIGVLTTDIVVFDLDTKHGKDAVGEYTKNGGHFNTLVVRTATGGMHCYFNGPDSRLRTGLLPGVDVRSHNGYVVGAGSHVDAELSGEPEIKATGDYTIEHDCADLPWVPAELEAKLEKPGKHERRDTSVELDTPTAIVTASEWLKTAAPAIEGEGGDNTTYQTAARLTRDFALSEEIAFELMARGWNERCVPPWPLDLLLRKIENAAAYGKGELGAARPEVIFGQVHMPPPAPPAHERGVYLGNLLEAKDIKARPWTVERLLLKGDVTIIGGAGAVGKSAFTLAAICHFAAGKDFGSYKLRGKRPLRILVYNAEDDREEQSRRVLAICMAYNLDYDLVRSNLASMDNVNDDFLLATLANGSPVQIPTSINYIVEAARRDQIDVIVLDPLVNLHTCNENDNSSMHYVMGILRRIARETGTALLTVHHTAKGTASNKGEQDTLRGASSIINSARVSLIISSLSDDDRKEMGIKDEDRHQFVRIDDVKANMFAKTGGALMYLKMESTRLSTGDLIGVPVPFGDKEKIAQQRQEMALIIMEELITIGKGSIGLSDATRLIIRESEVYKTMKEATLRLRIEGWFKRPVQLEGRPEKIALEREGALLMLKLI
jgi:hypothetical protein